MFRRARALGFLSALLACHHVPVATAADRKRPYDVPASQVEIGSYLIHQKSLSGVAEIGTYLPLKWTRFHSDSLDWKVEGAFSYFSKRGDGWRSLVAASGFRYWIDGSTSITPLLRLGVARAKGGSRPMLAYGADVLFEKSFTLDPDGDHRAHQLAIVEAQAGMMAYRGRGADASTRYGFVVATASYDWPFWRESWDDAHRKRAKLGLGVENQFGPGRAVERLFFAALSLRSEDPRTGRLFHKLDLSAGIGERSQHRLTLGYMRGF